MKILMGTCGVRWFKVCEYWIDQVDFIDKLKVKYMNHQDALQKLQTFFLENDYTHLLIYAEDIIATPDMVKLLIKNAKDYDYDVVSGVLNFDFSTNLLSVNKKDMRGINVMYARQYDMLPVTYVLDGDFIDTCWFNGMALTLIKRNVLERVQLYKPYRYVADNVLGLWKTRGTMFDLSFAIQLANLGIKHYVDKRVFCIHFGDTRKYINLRNKKPEVEFIKAKRPLEL